MGLFNKKELKRISELEVIVNDLQNDLKVITKKLLCYQQWS